MTTDADRARTFNPHCRRCADGPHVGMHDLDHETTTAADCTTETEVRLRELERRVAELEQRAFTAGYFAGHDDAHHDSRVAFPDAAYARWAARREAPDPDEKRRQVEALAAALGAKTGDGFVCLSDIAVLAYELGARVR